MATELGKAYVQIVPSTQGMATSINNDLNGVPNTFTSKFKNAIKVAALGKVLVDSIKMGANLEQSIGGIQTLFKENADEVIAYADQSWKTAGISANNYMELATSFSASLLQSLGGDTKKAASVTDMAIRDMSDNANKFGTDMQSIQNAYQGFAKQNYTMLDNLKLGYGGTKSEMERLLKDAEKISGVKYDISNLNDVYQAIHIVQGELGVTGTTAKEAATTLSGSFLSMKSALENFQADLVLGRNIEQSVGDLAESVATFFFGNLIPALGRIIASLPSVLFTFIKTGIPTLMNSLTSIIPDVVGVIADTLASIGDYINEFVNKFADDPSVALGGVKLAKNFIVAIAKSIPTLLKAVINLITSILEGLSTILGSLMMKAVNRMIQPLKNGFNAVKGWVNKIKSLFNITLKFKGIKLPHIKVSWNKKGALAKIASKLGLPGVPDFGVNWYKTGGIFDSPSIIGVGEAGREAVIPLDRLNEFTQSEDALDYDKLAKAIASALGLAKAEVVVQMDKDVLVRTTAPLFRRELDRLDTRNNRKLGMLGG